MVNRTASTLPVLHDPQLNGRVLIETIDGWQIYGADRRRPNYLRLFESSDCPIQMIKVPQHSAEPLLSILTPCSATAGRFEFVVGSAAPVRKCCYRCVCDRLSRNEGVKLPSHKEWIVYMLMDSVTFMNGAAPKELPNA